MTTYAILLSGDQDAWEDATPEERAAVFARHDKFSRLLGERGHAITGGAELTHSRTGKVVCTDAAGATLVSDGPYAEAAEQLSGFYLVESDDLEDLLQVCALLAGPGAVEVRATTGAGA